MTGILAVLAFAGLFALFGLIRPRAGCAGDPASCGRCADTCTKDRRDRPRHDQRHELRNDRGGELPDPPLEVHR